MAEMLTLAEEKIREQGRSDAAALAARAVSGKQSKDPHLACPGFQYRGDPRGQALQMGRDGLQAGAAA